MPRASLQNYIKAGEREFDEITFQTDEFAESVDVDADGTVHDKFGPLVLMMRETEAESGILRFLRFGPCR